MRYTVVTATYNRAPFLSRVYASLGRQTYAGDFEWLIIDDGSTDDTRDRVKRWQGEGKIARIRYLYKENGGKHTAWRVALNEIETPYVTEIDSDDELTPDALEIFDAHWKRLEARGDSERFLDIRTLCQKPDGTALSSSRFPEDVWEANLFDLIFGHRLFFEQACCWNTERLRDGAPVPEHFAYDDRAKNFAEGIRWARAARKYDTVFVNKFTRVYHVDGDNSYTRSFNLDRLDRFYNNIVADLYFVEENIDRFVEWPSYFIKAMIRYTSNSMIVGTPASRQLGDWGGPATQALWLATLPAGLGAFAVKKLLLGLGLSKRVNW